ncbi:MAG: YeeE/YedE family protein [Myxococcales bacterium]|nr:YeeE/YedE family protein [Myxococcales bacterium]
MTDFTPIASTLGGVFIGSAAALLLLTNGRICGVSGICGGLIEGDVGWRWRAAFVAGLILPGLVVSRLRPELFAWEVDRSFATLVIAGLLVGYGTRLGSGCTSGHGICGLSRVSPRSIVAACTFFAAAIVTYLLTTYVLFPGGGL